MKFGKGDASVDSMHVHDAIALARLAPANANRPATSVIHDTPDARLVLFRLAPSQAVAVHTSPSTVILTVLSGSGLLTGGANDQDITQGDVVTVEPSEPHGMRAVTEELVILATITPRPGTRKG
jgi:quercetin dioxygenase-like cupin family protein